MKNTIKLTIAFTLFSLFLASCGEPIDITAEYDVNKNSSKVPPVVIEAWIKSGNETQYVIVSKPASIKNSGKQFVNNATVTYSDDKGRSVNLTFVGNGRYETNAFEGINDGRIYKLVVGAEGKTYESFSKMPVTPLPIDSIRAVPNEDKPGKYIAKLYANVHTAFDEYYLFKLYKNDVLQNEPDDIFVANNNGLNGRIPGIELLDNYAKGDEIKCEFYSITKEAHDFHVGWQNQVNSDGGQFGGPPANIQGNIPGALGLFHASYIFRDSVVIK